MEGKDGKGRKEREGWMEGKEAEEGKKRQEREGRKGKNGWKEQRKDRSEEGMGGKNRERNEGCKRKEGKGGKDGSEEGKEGKKKERKEGRKEGNFDRTLKGKTSNAYNNLCIEDESEHSLGTYLILAHHKYKGNTEILTCAECRSSSDRRWPDRCVLQHLSVDTGCLLTWLLPGHRQ